MSAQTNKFKRAAKIAKRLYKTGRYKRYSDAMKAAFNQLARNPGFRKATKKRSRLGKSKRKIAVRNPAAKSVIAERIAHYELLKFKTTTKKNKRLYSKTIAAYKRAYKNLP